MRKNLINLIKEKFCYLKSENSIDNNQDFLVPKAIPGMGWDVNFSNPKAVRALILTIIIIIGLVIVSLL